MEARIEGNVETVMKTFKEYGFKFEQNEKAFKQLTINVENVGLEISKLKDKTAADQKLFITTLSNTQEKLYQDMQQTNDENRRLGTRQDAQDLELKRQNSKLEETLSRMDRTEDRLFEIEESIRRLDLVKAEDAAFKKNVERVDEILRGINLKVDQLESHCTALDNYLDKF